MDEKEGTFEITNTYTRYLGLAKNSNGLLPTKFPPYQYLDIDNLVLKESTKIDTALIYCTAEHFFSESLYWALRHGKDSCVLILDFEMFIDIVSQHVNPNYIFLATRSCEYSNRIVQEIDPGPNSLTNQHLVDPARVCFSKPENFKEQYEVRAVWNLTPRGLENSKESQSTKYDIERLRNFVMPVNFSTIDLVALEKQRKGVGAFGVRIFRRDKGIDEIIFDNPNEILSPICFLDKSEWKIGVRYTGKERIYKDGFLKITEPAVAGPGGIGPIFGTCSIENIEVIEFFYEEEYLKKLEEARSKNEIKEQKN